MTATTTTILPMLVWLAGPGAGILASFIFAWLRDNVTTGPSLVMSMLNGPRYARWSAFSLAAVLAALSAVAVAYLRSESVVSAVDVSLSATIAIVFSQLTHSLGLPSAPSAPTAAPDTPAV